MFVSGVIENIPHNKKDMLLSTDMQNVLNCYCKVEKFITKDFKHFEIQLYMSEHFTTPLTLLYAIEKISIPCQKSMIIHVIGANKVNICRVCEAKHKKLYVESYSLLYKDYFESRTFSKPDIVVGFNTCIRIYNTWINSLFMLTKVTCTFISTTI